MTLPGIWSQRDGRWGNILLGYNDSQPWNIYHYGCAITAAANILWWVTGDASWTPARVNQWLKDSGGYQPGGGILIWGKLAELMNQFGIQYHGFTADLNGTNNFLMPDNNFAIVQLTGPGFPMHFSAMPYVGRIADSWDAVLKPVTHYHFVGAHLFTHNAPQSAPVPPLSPAPVQAPIPAPPAPPAPSHEKPVQQPEPEIDAILQQLEPGKGGGVQPENLQNTPPVEEPAKPKETAMPKPEPMNPPEWVEVGPAGAFIRHTDTDEPIQRILPGTKFLAKYYDYNQLRNEYYLVSDNMAIQMTGYGVRVDELYRAAPPSVDSLAKPSDEPALVPVQLSDLGTVARGTVKALHALFGDWHIFLKKKDK